MKHLAALCLALLCSCACARSRVDLGLTRTETGAEVRWRDADRPLVIVVHPSAREWQLALARAAAHWNALLGCEALFLSDDMHPEAEAYALRSPGVVPAFGFDLPSCEPKDSVACFPHTLIRADVKTGSISATPLFLPNAPWLAEPKLKLWWIAVHELGHVFGLAHDGQGELEDPKMAWSIMQPRQTLDRSSMPPITEHDLRVVREIYCAPLSPVLH